MAGLELTVDLVNSYPYGVLFVNTLPWLAANLGLVLIFVVHVGD